METLNMANKDQFREAAQENAWSIIIIISDHKSSQSFENFD